MWLHTILCSAAVLLLNVYARPTTDASVSVPLTRVHNLEAKSHHTHPSIVHAQHINRGIRRLHTFTGRPEPSVHELTLNLERRLLSVEKRFNRQGLKHTLVQLKHELFDSNHSPGYSQQNANASQSNVVTKAHKPTHAHTIGLDIEANDIGYLGTLAIGTPPKEFSLLFDSGSSDMWVGGEGCISDAPGGSCGGSRLLGSTNSSSFNQSQTSWQIEYGTGNVSGKMVTDTVNFAGLKLKKHKFGIALNESRDFDGVHFDGIIGCGRSVLSRQFTPTFVDNLFSAGLIKAPIISYKIPRLSDSKDDGEVTIGALNPAKYRRHTRVTVPNISPLGYYEAQIDAVKMNGKSLKFQQKKTGVLDTGTTLFIVPELDATLIHAAIPGASYSNITSSWTLPCNTTSELSLRFGNRDFSIKPADLLFLPVDFTNLNGLCYSAISTGSIGGPEEWLIGDVFLKNIYFSTDASTNKITMAKLA